MPVQQPPAQPPVQFQQQQQQQQQQQAQPVFVEAKYLDTNESSARSRNEVSNAPVLSATQVNNYAMGELGFGPGWTKPVVSGNVNLYADEYGGVGIVAGVNIPFNGKSGKLQNRAIIARIERDEIENAARLAKVCHNIAEAGLQLRQDYAQGTKLEDCNRMFVKVAQAPAPRPPVTPDNVRQELAQMRQEMQALIQQNRDLRRQLLEVYERYDNPATNDGG